MSKRTLASFGGLLAALLLPVLVLPTRAAAAEKINSFHSDIIVNADGSLKVVEDINVHAEGVTIKHGIQRDFPVRFTDYTKARRTTSFELASVELDGATEPYELVPIDDGVRVRIGSADRVVSRGDHTYTLTYRTVNQLYDIGATDLLYWNVTGNGTEMPIDSADATVHFPKPLTASDTKLDSFTGIAGSTAHGSTQSIEDGVLHFKTTQPLPSGWGLTIQATFPKGMAQITDSAAVTPNVNGTGPSGSGLTGPQSAAPAGRSTGSGSGSGIPWYFYLLFPVFIIFSLISRVMSGCGGCLGGGGGFPGGGWFGGNSGGGWGGGSSGGSSGGGGGGGGGGFSGGSSGGGGGGGGTSGW